MLGVVNLPIVVTDIRAFSAPGDRPELGWLADECDPEVFERGRGEAVMADPKLSLTLQL